MHQHASQIHYLVIDDLILMKKILNRDDDQTLRFHKLEQIPMKYVIDEYDDDLEEQNKILTRILAKSPNLKRIFEGHGRFSASELEIIPEEYYGLVGNLSLDPETDEREELLESFLEKRPKLRKLTVTDCGHCSDT